MNTLRECISEAEESKVALGHFNISDSEQLRAIFRAARSLEVPIVIGTSEGEREFIGVRQAVALIRSLREEHNYPIFLNADHTYSLEKVEAAAKAGYDMVIYDAAGDTLEENIAGTKEAVARVREINPDIVIEGELGYIGKSSKLLEELPEGAAVTKEEMTTPEEAKQFVEETGVDALAPAVGNLHGMVKKGRNPNLDTERISAIREAAGVPLVLHGGSGVSDEDFTAAIEAGISVVHINTEIRIAYRKGIEAGLSDNPDEIAPYRFMAKGVSGVEETVANRLRLFNGQ